MILLNVYIFSRLHRRGKSFVLGRLPFLIRFFNVPAHPKNTVVRPLLLVTMLTPYRWLSARQMLGQLRHHPVTPLRLLDLAADELPPCKYNSINAVFTACTARSRAAWISCVISLKSDCGMSGVVMLLYEDQIKLGQVRYSRNFVATPFSPHT